MLESTFNISGVTPTFNVTFDGVRVTFSPGVRGRFPWGRKYTCEAADVRSVGGTSPAVEGCA